MKFFGDTTEGEEKNSLKEFVSMSLNGMQKNLELEIKRDNEYLERKKEGLKGLVETLSRKSSNEDDYSFLKKAIGKSNERGEFEKEVLSDIDSIVFHDEVLFDENPLVTGINGVTSICSSWPFTKLKDRLHEDELREPFADAVKENLNLEELYAVMECADYINSFLFETVDNFSIEETREVFNKLVDSEKVTGSEEEFFNEFSSVIFLYKVADNTTENADFLRRIILAGIIPLFGKYYSEHLGDLG